jgi:Na+:H+ antiporter
LHYSGLFTLLFVVASAVAVIARRTRVPYTVGLVVAGLALGTIRLVDPPHLTHEFLFALALPGLLFEAAFNLHAHELWRNRTTLALLALPGVVVATALTAVLLPDALGSIGGGATLAAGEALVFAALISATDPIAVLALFRQLGAPRRLTLLVEAESLLNDATAIALFVAAVAVATGTGAGSAATLVQGFVGSLVGGAIIGIAIGGAVTFAITKLDDPMVEITLTMVAGYGSFAEAQHMGASGVLATVAAGLLCGSSVARRGMSPATRVAVDAFWEYVAFALNSVVFLLIGFEVQSADLLEAWRPIVAAFLAVVLARAVAVGMVAVAVRPTKERLPWRWASVLTWGGLRGALSMVLALELPSSLPHRALLIAMTYGVVVVSILGQGLSVPPLLRYMRIIDSDPHRATTT